MAATRDEGLNDRPLSREERMQLAFLLLDPVRVFAGDTLHMLQLIGTTGALDIDIGQPDWLAQLGLRIFAGVVSHRSPAEWRAWLAKAMPATFDATLMLIPTIAQWLAEPTIEIDTAAHRTTRRPQTREDQ
jgi:hypothetical protein